MQYVADGGQCERRGKLFSRLRRGGWDVVVKPALGTHEYSLKWIFLVLILSIAGTLG